jgi:hypothetical protein
VIYITEPRGGPGRIHAIPTPREPEDHGVVEPGGSLETGEDEETGLVAPAESSQPGGSAAPEGEANGGGVDRPDRLRPGRHRVAFRGGRKHQPGSSAYRRET